MAESLSLISPRELQPPGLLGLKAWPSAPLSSAFPGLLLGRSEGIVPCLKRELHP